MEAHKIWGAINDPFYPTNNTAFAGVRGSNVAVVVCRVVAAADIIAVVVVAAGVNAVMSIGSVTTIGSVTNTLVLISSVFCSHVTRSDCESTNGVKQKRASREKRRKERKNIEKIRVRDGVGDLKQETKK